MLNSSIFVNADSGKSGLDTTEPLVDLQESVSSDLYGASGNIIIDGVDIGYAAGSYFSTTGQQCACHGRNTCGEASDCTCIKVSGCCQCYGFALWCENKMYGCNDVSAPGNFTNIGSISAGSLDETKLKDLISKASIGAHIRTGGSAHSMILLSKSDSGFTVAQANGSNNNEYTGYFRCRIGTATYTWTEYCNSSYGTRGIAFIKQSTTLPIPPSACICTTVYAGKYECTANTSLIIRSDHSSSSSKLGSIPNGATFEVSAGDGSWAHVSYNGISGYASMQYMKLVTLSPTPPTITDHDDVHFEYVNTTGFSIYAYFPDTFQGIACYCLDESGSNEIYSCTIDNGSYFWMPFAESSQERRYIVKLYPNGDWGREHWINGPGNFVTIPAKSSRYDDAVIFDNAVFAADFYRSLYDDLASLSDDELRNHWKCCGFDEGRIASPVYDVTYYALYNQDVVKAYGGDHYDITKHFVTFVVNGNEQRRSSETFNIQYYKNNNTDLKNLSNRDAFNHYMATYKNESRVTSENFNVQDYRANYANLNAAYGDSMQLYVIHYYKIGRYEGRIASGHFYCLLDYGDENVQTFNIVHKRSYSGLPVPTREGYVFNGWYDEDGKLITEDTICERKYVHVLTAEWDKSETYTVRFDGNGATSGTMDDQVFTIGTAQTLSENKYKMSYTVTYNYNGNGMANSNVVVNSTFSGWGTDASGTKVYSDKQSVTNLSSTDGAVVRLYAVWQYGSTILPTPTMTGYTFDGWYTSASGGVKVGNPYTPSSDITLYAHWNMNNIPVSDVTISDKSIILTVGEYLTLTATITPSDATNKNVIWTSSDESVATVSTSGVVSGISKGSAVIIATTVDGGKVAFCNVTVKSAIYYGDVTGNGVISSADGTVLARYIAGFVVEDFVEDNADVDGDGYITPRDSMILARYLAEWTGYDTLPYKD